MSTYRILLRINQSHVFYECSFNKLPAAVHVALLCPTRTDDAQLQQRMIELAAQRRRFRYRRIHVLLRSARYRGQSQARVSFIPTSRTQRAMPSPASMDGGRARTVCAPKSPSIYWCITASPACMFRVRWIRRRNFVAIPAPLVSQRAEQ